MAKRNLYPYEVAMNAIQLRAVNPTDPTNPGATFEWLEDERTRPEGAQQLDLRGSHPWRQLRIEVRANIDTRRIRDLIPPGTDYQTDTALLLSLRCPSTKLRTVVPMEWTSDGHWVGDLQLDRHATRSRVEVHAILHRVSSIPADRGASGRFALDRNAVLATAVPLIISIDYVERALAGAVRIRWEDFRASTNPWRRSHAASLYFLEVDLEEPVLWLNQAVDRVEAVLFERSDTGSDAALKQLLSAWFAETVWIQLVHTALAGLVDPENGTVGELPDGWRGDVLRSFLPRMFPELEIEDAIQTAADMYRNGDRVGSLSGLISTVVQDEVKSQRSFNTAIRCIEGEQDVGAGEER